MVKSKKDTSQVKEKNVEVVEKKESTLYYFYSVGCGFCKKADPIIDELIKEGHDILRLDLADKDNQGLKKELSDKYKKQCGTPWFIDGGTGNQVCGFRDKDTILKWVNGEDIPAPPKPNGIPPRPPFLNAKKAEVTKWKKDYNKWLGDNEHLPEDRRKTADEILDMPRPKSAPPQAPSPQSSDAELDAWGKKYSKWREENSHLPRLQPVENILHNFKNRRKQLDQQQQKPDTQISENLIKRIDEIETKLDKLIKHLGVK